MASQIDDRKTTLAFLNSIQSISKVTYPNNYPSTYRFSRELEDGKISSSAHRLISAIRSKDFGMLHCLLQKQKKIFSPVDAAWICHFALELDATIFEEILKFCPAPETFIFHVKCPAYNFLRYMKTLIKALFKALMIFTWDNVKHKQVGSRMVPRVTSLSQIRKPEFYSGCYIFSLNLFFCYF